MLDFVFYAEYNTNSLRILIGHVGPDGLVAFYYQIGTEFQEI